MNQLEILLKLRNETKAGFDQLEKSVGDVKKQTDSLNTSAAASATGLGGMGKAAFAAVGGVAALSVAAIGALGALKAMTAEFAAAGSELVDLKKQTGVGVVELQKMQFAAKQAGVDLGGLTTSLTMMERAASKSPEKFAQLGISFGQLRASKPEELMVLISDGLKGVSDQNERARIAMEIFGRSGSGMLKMLTDDYRGLLTEAEKTGLMTEEMAQRADKLDDAMSKLGDALGKVKINLGAAFANPGMIRAMEGMASAMGFMARNAEKVYLAFKMFGGGAGLMLQGLESLGGGDAAVPASGSGGGRLILGKGYDKTTKALADLDKALDKLDAKMVKELEKAAKATSKLVAEEKKLFEQRSKALKTATPLGGFQFWQVGTESKYEINTLPAGDPKKVYNLWGDSSKFMPPELEGNIHVSAGAMKLAAESAERWAGALQGVALMAGAIGGKLGETINVMGNIGRSFEGWEKLTKSGRFNAVAGGVGQIGGLVGGSAGAGIQGGAGGAMMGNALASALKISGPWGAIAGGAIGLIGGLFGASKAKKQELDGLKKQLEGMSDAAKKFGISLDSAFASKNSSVVKGAIDQVNAAIKESEKRIAGLTSAAGGLNAFVKGGAITDQASSDRAGMYAGAIFGGQVKETGDVVGALQSIGPALAEMAAKAKELGLGVSDVVSNLLGMNNVLAENEGLAGQLSGLNQMMKGLSDAGMITSNMFAALGADASAVFGRLIAGGATGNQALTLMQPTLQQLYEGQKLHGYAVDETTQGLLDQAKAEGIVGDAFMSANERIVELLGILIETLGGTLPESYRRAGDAAEEYGRRATNAIPTYPTDGGIRPDPPGPGFADGTAFRNFGSGTRVTLHGEEAVLRRDQVDRLVGMAVAGAPVSAAGGSNGGPIMVNVVLDGSVLATALAKQIDRNSPGGSAIKTAIAGRA